MDPTHPLAPDSFHPHHTPDRFTATVKRCLDALDPFRDWFDAIAVRGASGMTVGSVVAWTMGKRLVVVRKPGENPHCYHGISGIISGIPSSRILFLDDFFATGETFEAIKTALGRTPGLVVLYANTPFQGYHRPAWFNLTELEHRVWTPA